MSDVFNVQPCYHALVDALARSGVWQLQKAVSVGTPLRPMTAAPAVSVAEVISRLGGDVPFLAEVKYDGERCQLHVLPPSAGPTHSVDTPSAQMGQRTHRATSEDATAEAAEAVGVNATESGGGAACVSSGEQQLGSRVRLYSRSLDDMTVRDARG